MSNMTAVEVKAFVPAKDFDLSKRFYEDLGFSLAWASDALAYFRHGNSAFLLQNFYNKEQVLGRERKSVGLERKPPIAGLECWRETAAAMTKADGFVVAI